MNVFLLGVLIILIGWYFFRVRQSEKIILQLLKAVDEKRRFLLKESSSKMQTKNLEKLVLSVNTLIDDYGVDLSETSGFSNQVEATLSSIQEAVFVLNDDHIIEYANESAERIFNFGREMESVRLESMVRSTSLLEYLANKTLVTKIVGCEYSVRFIFSSGPFRSKSFKSKSRDLETSSMIDFTSETSSKSEFSMPTFWTP